MRKLRGPARPYRAAIIGVAAAAALATVPLLQSSAHADVSPACAAATATVTADQDHVNHLYDELRAAKDELAEDQAALDEVNKDVAHDNDVIDQYEQLEDAADDDSDKVKEELGSVLSSLLLQPADHAKESVIKLLREQVEEDLNDAIQAVEDLGENTVASAEQLAEVNRRQLAYLAGELSEPALLFLGAVELFEFSKEVGSAIVAVGAQLTTLYQMSSLEDDYNRADKEIDALTDRQDDLQQRVTTEQTDVDDLTAGAGDASDALQQALQDEATACQPSPNPTPTDTDSDTPTPTPTPTDSGTPTPTPTDSGTPTPPPPPDHAQTYGDPHLVTFDGVHYDFQQVGEFVLTKSTVDNFEIQVRQGPWAGTSTSVAENSAAAFDVAGDRVGIYTTASGDLTTMVNGTAVTLPDSTAYQLPGGGSITSVPSVDEEIVTWPNGTVVTVTSGGFYLVLTINVAESEHGHLVGLLGNDDGNPEGDLVTADGTVLPDSPTTAELYGDYSSSWRVTDADSLFDYTAGQSTATFTDLNFPYAPATLSGLPAATEQSAAATCAALGVTAEPYLDDCILDVGTTGDTSAGEAEVTAQSAGSSTPGNLLVNSSFEAPSDNGSTYIEYGGGSTAIPGWTVGGDSVDVTSTSYWQADDGTQSVDLAGSGPGSVSQTVATTAGATYTLSWALAGNTNCGSSVKTMDVDWNGTVVDAPTFDTTNTTNADMGYVQEQVTVTATGPSSTLTFSDATAGDTLCGPVLDNVSLVPQN
jgi:choice-of-anchor C domain-containing protein